MLAVIPKHKGTEKLQADLKPKLSRLQHEVEQHHRSGARLHDPGHVPREGSGQIALIGPPNSGRSSLLRALSHAAPEVAEYPFTTQVPQPGMVPFEDVQIQVVDTPAMAGEPFDPVLINVARVVKEELRTLEDLARDALGDDLAEYLKFARIWGSAKIDGLPAEHDRVLEDRDVVEVHA